MKVLTTSLWCLHLNNPINDDNPNKLISPDNPNNLKSPDSPTYLNNPNSANNLITLVTQVILQL